MKSLERIIEEEDRLLKKKDDLGITAISPYLRGGNSVQPLMDNITVPAGQNESLKVPKLNISTEITEALTQAITIGLTNAVLNIVQSPEVSDLVENIAKGRAISGMLEALCANMGRKGLDPTLTEQNKIEITHTINNAFDYFKSHQKDKLNGVLDPEMKDAEKDFKIWDSKDETK